jgi:hypothetical protein
VAHSQSSIKSWRRCQKQYAFRRDYAPEGKELVRRAPKLALRRGDWMHKLQEAHHRAWAGVKKGSDWEQVHEKMTAKFNAYFDEDKEELGDLPTECDRMFRAYLRNWEANDAERYTVAQLPDGGPAIEFIVEAPLSKWGIKEPFKGRIDLMVEDHEYGGLWVWDAKWVRRIPDVDDRMMSPQSLLYPWALKKQYDIDLAGFVYNYGRTKAPTIPRVLQRPAGQLSMAKNIDTDYMTYLRAIHQQHGDRWKFYARTTYRDVLIRLKHRDKLWFRRERIPIDAARMKQAVVEFIVSARQAQHRSSPAQAPRTYLYNCGHANAGCDYHDLCVTEFKGLNIAPLIRDRYELVPERYIEEDLLTG